MALVLDRHGHGVDAELNVLPGHGDMGVSDVDEAAHLDNRGDDDIGEYSLFESDQAGLRQDVWKATDVLDDYARVECKGYGYVDDLIFNNDGVLTAVIVNSDVAFGGGPRAFPWSGDPAAPTYDLPYEEAEVIEQAPFDREQLGGEPQ